jgi:hypothetical protein
MISSILKFFQPCLRTIGCFELSDAHQWRTRYLLTHVTSYELASKARLEAFDIQYDTTAFEFYGSEMYARGIPLTDENSPWINVNSSLFTKEEMDGFKILANKVNQTGQAGRAAFFLRKAQT